MTGEFYINQIDEAFAEMFLDEGSALNIHMEIDKSCGLVSAKKTACEVYKLKNGIDFELSTSECCGLNDLQLNDYLNKTVHTSSAFEFFDFVFSFAEEVDADIEFAGDCWKIRLNRCK